MGLLKQRGESHKNTDDEAIPFIVDRSLISEAESARRARERAAIACALWLSRTPQYRAAEASGWRESGRIQSVNKWRK